MENKKIKILMVMGNTRMGGVQSFVLNLLHNIDLNRFHIDFAINFFAESDGIEDECRKYGCRFYIMPYFKVWNYFSYKRSWRKFLKSHSYDIVYAHATNSASIFLKIAKKYGMKTISHSHSAGFRGGKVEQLAKKYFAKKVGKVSDYWFACSDIAATRLYGKNFRQYPHYYDIPNAIDVKAYRFDNRIREAVRASLGIDKNTLLIGHVGTFSAPKNHKFLIETFDEVLKINPNSKLICCGAGSLLPKIKEIAADKDILDRIIFPGVVKNANEFMMAMDVFVFPSIFEGFPISILEAQASGLPVYMSDVITHDVDLTDLVNRYSLQQPSSEWAGKIANIMPAVDRGTYNEIISETKYNIQNAIKWQEECYVELANS